MADHVSQVFKGSQNGVGTYTPIDLNSDPIYVMLLNSTFFGLSNATIRAFDYRDDLTTYEITATGYTAGGQALSGLTLTLSAPNYIWDATDPSWAGFDGTARGCALFKRVGADLSTPADDPFICALDFGADKTASGGTFLIQFNAGGIMLIQ
jgi:hypothetical protein